MKEKVRQPGGQCTNYGRLVHEDDSLESCYQSSSAEMQRPLSRASSLASESTKARVDAKYLVKADIVSNGVCVC